MDDNITKTQEASEREETDENEDKCTEGVEDNGNIMVDPTPIMTDEQQNDLHEDVSGEQKSFANMWKKRTQQKSSQISDDVDVNDDTNTTPRTRIHRPASSVIFQTPHPDTLRKASSYRLSTSALGKVHLSKIVNLVQRKGKLKPSAAAPSGEGGDEEEPNRCSSSITFMSADTLDDPQADFENVPEDERPFSRKTVDNENREQSTYLRACKKYHTAPSTMVLRRISEKTLNLKHHNLGPRGVKALAIALVNNVNVQSLDLTGNDIGKEGVQYVHELMVENSYITHLSLADNSLGSQGLEIVAECVKEHPFLQKLDLSGNDFNESDAVHIAEMLEDNRSLKDLNISHNSFREKGGEIIAPVLASNDNLERFDMSWNHLRRRGAVALCEGLRQNISLQYVNLAWNGLHLDGSRTLTKVLKENATLQELDLTCNRIDTTCLDYILRGLKLNSGLHCLRLGSNPITSDGAMKILQTIKLCGAKLPLKVLDLSGQSVEQKFVEVVDEIREIKPFRAMHGPIREQNGLGGENKIDAFLHEDPMMVLMEFMRIQNFRLVDLFTSLDKDGSKSLTRKEFRDGLLGVNIPMSPKMLNKLIDNLDADGDGEVDFRELLDGQKEHKRKLHILQQRNKSNELPWEETELGRINVTIKALLALKAAADTAKREKEAVEQKQASLVKTTAQAVIKRTKDKQQTPTAN